MQMGDTTTDLMANGQDVPWWQSVASGLVSVYQQKSLVDVNIKRAAAGLPPIDSTAAAAQVNVSANPQQVQQAQTIALIGIGAIVLTIILMRRSK